MDDFKKKFIPNGLLYPGRHRFSSSCIGKTRDQVIEELGEPTDVAMTTKRNKHPLIYKYGDVEYYFGPKQNDVCYVIVEQPNDPTQDDPEVLAGKW